MYLTYYMHFAGIKELIGSTRWHSGWGTAPQTRSMRGRLPMLSLEFFIDIILPAALWPWGSLSLWRKWVPGIFPGVKAAGAYGWQCCHLNVTMVLNLIAPNFWNLQGLSRPVMGLLYLSKSTVLRRIKISLYFNLLLILQYFMFCVRAVILTEDGVRWIEMCRRYKV
jgi:hypothetical protein